MSVKLLVMDVDGTLTDKVASTFIITKGDLIDMRINDSYVYSHKRNDIQERYNYFKQENDLNVYEYKNATILPLKRFDEDALLFGRGGYFG